MVGSLTGANTVLMLSIANLFPSPQQLQGFAADDIYDIGQIQSVETVMGVDGILSGGFVFAEVEQTISLQANSPSVSIFQQWWASMQQQQDTLIAAMTTYLPSLGLKFNHSNGFLTGYPPMPGIKKIAQPMRFQVRWGRIVPAPI